MSKKILSICLVFIISLTLMVPVCFAEAAPFFTEIVGFDGNLVTSTYLVEWNGGSNYEPSPGQETAYHSGGYSLFTANLPAEGVVTTSFLRISQPVVYLPIEGYDTYFVSVIRGMTRLPPAYQNEFSFYPSSAKLYSVNDTHNGVEALNVSDIIHTDARYPDQDGVFMGFSAIWKLNPIDNNSVSYIEYTSSGNGNIHRNTAFNNYIIYVPAESGSDQSVQAIVSAIQDQTSQIITEESKQTDILQNDHTGTADSMDDIASSFNQIVDEIHDAESALLEGVDSNFDKVDEYMTNYNVHDIIQNDGKFYKHVSSRMFEALKGYQVIVILPLIVGAVVAIINASKAGRR